MTRESIVFRNKSLETAEIISKEKHPPLIVVKTNPYILIWGSSEVSPHLRVNRFPCQRFIV